MLDSDDPSIEQITRESLAMPDQMTSEFQQGKNNEIEESVMSSHSTPKQSPRKMDAEGRQK